MLFRLHKPLGSWHIMGGLLTSEWRPYLPTHAVRPVRLGLGGTGTERGGKGATASGSGVFLPIWHMELLYAGIYDTGREIPGFNSIEFHHFGVRFSRKAPIPSCLCSVLMLW